MRLAVSLAIAALLIPLAASPAGGAERQDKTPEYSIQVGRVAIPVYVHHRDGTPVLGLQAADFEVFEGKTACEIEAVEFIDHMARRSEAYADSPPEARRQFVLLFDLSFTRKAGLTSARDAARRFIEQSTAPGDLLSLATVSIRKGINLVCPLTADRERVLAILSDLGRGDVAMHRESPGFAHAEDEDFIEWATDGDDLLKLLQKTDRMRYAGLVQDYLGSLQLMAEAIGRLRGRKNIVLFSEGFDEQVVFGNLVSWARDSEMTTGVEESLSHTPGEGEGAMLDRFMEAIAEVRKSGSVVYAVNTSRLRPTLDASSRFNAQDFSLFKMAHETNGEVYNNLNNLSVALDEVAARTAVGYLVVFKPSKPGQPGEYRDVDIEVRGEGLRVNHQRGYTFDKAWSEYTEAEKRLQLEEHIVKEIASRQVPFRFDAQCFEGDANYARIPFVVEIAGREMLQQRWQTGAERVELEIYGFLAAGDKTVDKIADQVSVGTPELVRRFSDSGIKYFAMLFAPPGSYRLKLIIRDADTGRIGSDFVDIEVPDFGGGELRLTGPIFIEKGRQWMNVVNEESKQATGRREGMPVSYPYVWGGNRWMPTTAPPIGPDRETVVFLRMHGLQRDAGDKLPRYELSFEVLGARESQPMAVEWQYAAAGENGAHGDRLVRLRLDALQLDPGHYRLRAKVADLISGQAAAADVPFEVGGGTTAPDNAMEN